MWTELGWNQMHWRLCFKILASKLFNSLKSFFSIAITGIIIRKVVKTGTFSTLYTLFLYQDTKPVTVICHFVIILFLEGNWARIVCFDGSSELKEKCGWRFLMTRVLYYWPNCSQRGVYILAEGNWDVIRSLRMFNTNSVSVLLLIFFFLL